MNVSGSMKASVSLSENLSAGLGSGTLNDSVSVNQSLNNGTGSCNVALRYTISKTANAAADTYTLSATTDALNRAVAFTKVRLLVIVNQSTTDGQDLIVGNAALHPWSAPFNGVGTSDIIVKAGGTLILLAPLATAFPVTSGVSDQLKIDPGANAVPYQLLIAGE